MNTFISFFILLSMVSVVVVWFLRKKRAHHDAQSVGRGQVPESVHCSIPTITIFIHGTRVFPKFYIQELFYSPEGLTHISAIERASHMHTIARTLEQADPERYPYEYFYAFGWSGVLSFQGRQKAAIDLYGALKNISAAYVGAHVIRPRVRIITHSHGGNVALNLAGVSKDVGDTSFFIDELIMLAVPVQQKTKDLVVAPCFGRVYSLSSSCDVLQIIDPQGLYAHNDRGPFFSERYFKGCPAVLQASIKMRGCFVMHIEFLMKKFFKHLPAITGIMDAWYTRAHKLSLPMRQVPTIDVRDGMITISPQLGDT
jgi:heme/copper-type cytochrome/quinol oxidase subunit 2